MITATLHGFTGHPDAWRRAAPSSVGLPVLGHHPELPAAGGSFSGEVERLAARLEALGSPIHLCGYSMGARLALGVATARPRRIARLTLVGVHPGLESEEARHRRRREDERWCALLEQRGIEAFVDAWQALPLWDSQRRLPEGTRAAQRAARLAHHPAQLAGALRALGLGAMPPLWSALAALPMPVDLVAGALDDKFCHLAEQAAARIRRARVVVIPDAGHNPVLERPRALAAALWPPAAPGPSHSLRRNL